MSLNRREFLQLLAVASAGGFPLTHAAESAYSYAFAPFGNVSLLHLTDCHAQLLPVYLRESSINLGVGSWRNRPPHLVGGNFLNYFGVAANSAESYAFTSLQFEKAARLYGKLGGFAHLASLVKNLKVSRPGALLLDGGDTWQGSGTSLWSNGQDMVDAAKLLGVDVMTIHWEATLGEERIKEIEENDFKGTIDIVAQNVTTTDFGDAAFKPYVMRVIKGVPVAIIGQAFPYTPIANPRWMAPNWTYGIREENMQKMVHEVRDKGAQVVVLLSHNGMDVDLKLATRVSGIDAILGGHTHDATPAPIIVANASGKTLVTNAGSNGKFLGVLDFEVKGDRVQDFRYKLLPVFSNLLTPDAKMQEFIAKVRAPYLAQLDEKLAVTEDTLYRRGNFNGTFDQLICDALMEVKGADIAFSPGFRWGTSLLPADTIRMEHVLEQTAITYPWTTLSDMKGSTIKTILEDVADNLFNPDPYYQQGGDMVRVGGLQYTCEPNAKMGERIQDMRLRGKLIDADKTYKVAGWAPVAEASRNAGAPAWEVVAEYLRSHKIIKPVRPNTPKLKGVAGNLGILGTR